MQFVELEPCSSAFQRELPPRRRRHFRLFILLNSFITVLV